MWMLLVFDVLFFCQLVCSVQVNTTIDDASPLVQYRAPPLDRSLTGFDPSRLNNQTITFIPATTNDSPTIAMNFTGTAIYIFVAYPVGHNESSTSGFVARIDDIPSGGWAVDQTAPLYNHLAYRNTTLSNRLHNLVIQIQPKWELYFDYAVYTSGDPDPASPPTLDPATSPTSGPATSPTSDPATPPTSGPATSPTSGPATLPASGPASSPASGPATSPTSGPATSPTSDPANLPISGPATSQNPSTASSRTTKKISVGAVVGGIVGGLFILALLSIPFLLRRKALGKRKPNPFPVGLPTGESGEEKDSAPPPTPPFILQSPSPARSKYERATSDSELRLGIPTARPLTLSTDQSPLSAASDPALLDIADNLRRLTASVQRLETEIPEARDGGPVLQRPPAYYTTQ
ncbi:hypothetical protein C8R44DRAFT_818798 [Mycena epipterygia]|nr:hypothetical protein C8R44DRAFT_818798 [Mycena epipterygia]